MKRIALLLAAAAFGAAASEKLQLLVGSASDDIRETAEVRI